MTRKAWIFIGVAFPLDKHISKVLNCLITLTARRETEKLWTAGLIAMVAKLQLLKYMTLFKNHSNTILVIAHKESPE